MSDKDRSDRYCIIGAGAAGITAAKNLQAMGVGYDLIESEDDVGGNWYFGQPCSSTYRSVHMISSKPFSEYTDFPMPAEYPTYLRGDQALRYLRDYARHFGIYAHTEFRRTVLEAAPDADGQWDVRLDGGETRRYRGVIVANGHLSSPRLPETPGEFDGLQLHSSQYKTPECLAGKRVLVVGAGNSGCDIAAEAVHHAAAVFHSTRRGYYYWPKFLFGIPADRWAEWPLRMRMPLFLRRLAGQYILRQFTAGHAEDYGLPAPDHKLFESHFIINSTLFYHLAHGDIAARPDLAALDGKRVRFADGREEEIDVIVYATGFRLAFPFLDQAHLGWSKDAPELAMNVFDRRHPNLFFIGLFQTSTGNWPLMDYQSQLLARYLAACRTAPARAARLRRRITTQRERVTGGIRFAAVPRHAIEVEHFVYRKALRRLIDTLPGAPARDPQHPGFSLGSILARLRRGAAMPVTAGQEE